MPQGPHELPFVLDVPEAGTTRTQHQNFDVYRPAEVARPLPAIVFVPGPVHPQQIPVPPRGWPVYQGYGRLAAGNGVVGVIAAPTYQLMSDWATAEVELARIVAEVRALDGVAGDQVVIWAFSGGAQLISAWLADSPHWLRGLALTYPAVRCTELTPGRPILLTQVGQERPEIAATQTEFLAAAEAAGVAVRVIDVPDGAHGFDLLEPVAGAADAVIEAMATVTGWLA